LPQQIRGRLEEVATIENVPLTENGIEAILDLSCGDMRRVLNLLQSTSMSNLSSTSSSTTITITTDMDIDNGGDGGDDKGISTVQGVIPIDETAVYLTSGSPLPKDVDIILLSLLNDTFRDSCNKICTLCTTKGYALVDVLKLLTMKLCGMVGLDSIPLGKLLDGMSQVKCRLATNGVEEKIQTASLVGIFVETRQLLDM